VVVAAIEALWARSCIIDGELAKCDEQGRPVFDLLRTGRAPRPTSRCFHSTFWNSTARICDASPPRRARRD
jgi:ATP-dependent DNA ligase